MLGVSVIIFGLLALPDVLGYQVRWDGQGWRKLSGGIDPGLIHRHVYVLSEWCPDEPRAMRFGDEVIVESQRPWQAFYAANTSCTIEFTREQDDVGLIVNVLTADTVDCQDYLRISPSFSGSNLFCGPKKNVTGKADNYMNETIRLDWKTSPRNVRKHTQGVRVLLTAFQQTCKPDQTCFPCTNGLIIDQVHMCNGVDNCGDNSDEHACRPVYPPPTASSWPMYFMICMFVLSLMALAVLGLVTFRFYNERNLARQTRPGETRNLFVDDERQP